MAVDAYLEEELYDLLTFCIQNPESPQVAAKKQRIQEIGRELFADGADALENMFFSIEHRIKGEIQRDAKPYRAWWNGISDEWSY
jgi:thermostable 8-oxoguanine DNA glycosylase